MHYLKIFLLVVLLTLCVTNQTLCEEAKWDLIIKQGMNYLEYNDIDKAEKPLKEAYSLAVSSNDKKQIYYSLTKLGDLYRAQFKYSKAVNCYKEALSVQKEVMAKFLVINCNV